MIKVLIKLLKSVFCFLSIHNWKNLPVASDYKYYICTNCRKTVKLKDKQ